MLVSSSKISYTTNGIILNNNNIIIGDKTFNLKEPWSLARLNSDEPIDLNFISKKLDIIKKKKNFDNVLFIIEEQGEGMYIEIHYSSPTKVSAVDIHVDYAFLSNLDEEEAIIFSCHELGHLIDSQSLISQETFFKSWDGVTKFLGIGLIGAFYIMYVQALEPMVQMLYFMGSIITVFGLAFLFKNLLKSYLQRRNEYVADALAVTLFGDLESVIRALKLLNTIEDVPNKNNLFSTHPTINQRIKALKRRFWYKILFKSLWG